MSKLDEIFKDMAGGNPPEEVKEETPVETPVEIPEEEIEEVEEIEEEETEEVTTEEEVVEESEEEAEEEEETPKEEEDEPELWDAEEEEEIEAEDPEVLQKQKINELAKELEIDGVENLEDLKGKLKEKIESLQTKEFEVEKVLNDIPDDLAEAVKLAKEGGDYLEYLKVGQLDLDSYSDYDLVANSISDYFLDEGGNVNEEELENHMENLSEKQIEIEAGRIKNTITQNRESVKQNIANEAQAKKDARISGVKNVLENMENISGYKLTPNHKKSLLKDFEADKVIKDMFFDKAGNFDYQKAVISVFRNKYWDKIEAYRTRTAKTEQKKEIIETMSNADIQKRSEPVKTTAKQDALSQFVNDLRTK